MKTVLKKFCGDQAAPKKEVLDVNVLDHEGNPVKESELTEEQIQFCAKVAAKAYRKFSESKRIKFSAEEDAIDVVLPEDVTTADVESTVDDMVSDKIAEQADPEEVVTEVEEEADDIDPAGEEDTKEFASEDVKEAEELEKEMEKAVDDIPAEEELDPKDTNESGAEGVGDIKEFAAKAINSIIGKDSVMQAKAKFFAAQRRK